MNIKQHSRVFAAILFFLALALCFPPLSPAAPLQAQPPAQPADQSNLTEIAPSLFAITEAGGNGNVAF